MDRPVHTDPDPDLQTQQVHVLYRNMPTGVSASAVNAGMFVAVAWPVVPHRLLLLWLSVIWILGASRAVLVGNFRRAVPASWRSGDWHRWMLLSTTLSGIGWGSSVYFLTPEIPLPNELMLVFLLGGMAAGAISVLSVSFPMFLCFALPVTLPHPRTSFSERSRFPPDHGNYGDAFSYFHYPLGVEFQSA